jgi:hypothetical protein
VLFTIALIHVLDDFLPPISGEIHVNVGHCVGLGTPSPRRWRDCEEALEEQVMA